MANNDRLLSLMTDVQEAPPPFNTPLLVTNGNVFATCILSKEMRNVYMTGYGFSGYEYDFDFEPNDITHWMEV